MTLCALCTNGTRISLNALYRASRLGGHNAFAIAVAGSVDYGLALGIVAARTSLVRVMTGLGTSCILGFNVYKIVAECSYDRISTHGTSLCGGTGCSSTGGTRFTFPRAQNYSTTGITIDICLRRRIHKSSVRQSYV